MPNGNIVKEIAAKHTPGPWRAREHNSGASIVDAGPFQILLTNTVGATADVWTANARLIAAAPELLQLVKEALDEFENPHSLLDIRDWMAAAKAAIAKAEQRS